MKSFIEMNKTVRIIIPKDWKNEEKGNFFEKIAGNLLKRQRYEVIQRVRFTGMEIDLIANHKDTNEKIFVECKFTADPFSANVLHTLIGKAIIKNIKTAYLFSIAPPSKDAKGIIEELKEKRPEHSPNIVFINPEKLAEMFIDVFNAQPDLPKKIKNASIGSAFLIIMPNFSPFWIFEEYQNGIPKRAIIQHALRGEKTIPSESDLSEILKENDLFQGLALIYKTARKDEILDISKVHTVAPSEDEVVATVAVADSLDDYRPCKPQHFVGRNDIQKNIWDFLNDVREDNTNTRILALSGPSGFGKSSIILKLADRFRNIKWMNKYYVFSVDVRSARSPLFVAKALRIALQSAMDDGFVPMQLLNISIESTGTFLQSDSVQLALDSLKSSNRIILLFFDQFEEIFTKDELLSTFDLFKKLAFEVNSARANIVIGFSWRTGITLSDDNPAYHVWHGLKDIRKDIILGEFTSAESSQLIGQFERELSQRLLHPLRRSLLEQGQGLPWHLKKLCIHIYREIKKGTQQEELLTRRLNIKALFDEDLEHLTDSQVNCLEYIAKNSPANFVDITDNFNTKTVSLLYNERLIVRAGQKYAVYWDIFREYLDKGIIPTIPWTYVPQVNFSTAIRSFFLIRDEGPLDLISLGKILGYAEKTMFNVVGDLQNFLLISRLENGKYIIRTELKDSNDKEIAEFLNKQMKEHILVQKVFEILDPGKSLTIDDFRKIIASSYATANLKKKSINVYFTRFLPWFRFVGLFDFSEEILLRPIGIGKDFGKFDFLSRRRLGTVLGFVCSTSPDKVFNLAKELVNSSSITKEKIYKQKKRNAAYDLISLDLAYWRYKILFPKNLLIKAYKESEDKIFDIISSRALSSDLLKELLSLIKLNLNAPISKIGMELSKKFDKNWSESSAFRYASAGRLWLRFFGRI